MISPLPDVVLLSPDWQPRALLRAQLLEEGYETVAFDEWAAARTYLTSLDKPRLVIVDLHGLAEPQAVLDELKTLIDPGRVLVIAALGTLPEETLRKRGFHVIARPATIGGIVAAAKARLAARAPR